MHRHIFAYLNSINDDDNLLIPGLILNLKISCSCEFEEANTKFYFNNYSRISKTKATQRFLIVRVKSINSSRLFARRNWSNNTASTATPDCQLLHILSSHPYLRQAVHSARVSHFSASKFQVS